MMYHAPTKQFVVPAGTLEIVVLNLRYAMQGVRLLGDWPLEPHKRPVQMTRACHVEMALIEAATRIGIDLGGQRPGEIDLRDAP